MIIYDLIAYSSEQTLKIADLFVRNVLIKKLNIECTIVYLVGDLGAGKTTFMRGVLASFGFVGPVKSPTYTIVETYCNLIAPIYHFDLYRLEQPKELEMLGIRDYLQDQSICFFEWPNKGCGHIPDPNFLINFDIIDDNSRQIKISS